MMSLLSLIMKPSTHATLSFAEPVCLAVYAVLSLVPILPGNKAMLTT